MNLLFSFLPFLHFQHTKLLAGPLGTTVSKCGCPIGSKKDSSSLQFSNQLLRSSFGKGQNQIDPWAAMCKAYVSNSAQLLKTPLSTVLKSAKS